MLAVEVERPVAESVGARWAVCESVWLPVSANAVKDRKVGSVTCILTGCFSYLISDGAEPTLDEKLITYALRSRSLSI